MVNNEQTVWEGSSSQILNFLSHVTCIFITLILVVVGTFFIPLAYIGIPFVLLYMLTEYLIVKNQSYRLTNERIIIKRGVLSKVTDELELYRVKDHRLEQPFFFRMFGLGNIVLITSDQLNKEVYMVALKDAESLRESIRRLVEERRKARGVRELDTH